jgi:hypothetical protein
VRKAKKMPARGHLMKIRFKNKWLVRNPQINNDQKNINRKNIVAGFTNL